MAWEVIEAANRGGVYGAEWKTTPAVSLSSTCVVFNKPAADTFRLRKGQYVRVLFDSSRRIIGLKVVPAGETIEGAYKVGGEKDCKNLSITCKTLCNKVQDCWKRAFRCHLNPGERIIEVDLSPDNQLPR
jgi:hypothetical protein